MPDNKQTEDNILSLLQNQEERVNYNFNTLLQMTILVEYMFSKLNESMPDLNLEKDFEPFQKKRIEEFNKMTEEAIQSAQDIASETQKEILDKIKL
jgi:hypothetical protein